MKTYKTTFILFWFLCCMSAHAQTDDQAIWIKSPFFWVEYTTTVDEKTNEEIIVWPSTENMTTDTCWVQNVPLLEGEEFIGNIFPGFREMYLPSGKTTVSWLLTEENGETVLHCCLVMPGDAVTNLWLANEETFILDRETGIHYRARRTEPNCWGKHFGARAKKGDILDLRIYFPPLPKTTRSISIYGVPNWFLRGDRELKLHRNRMIEYLAMGWYFDSIPNFHYPHLIKEERQYEKSDENSWAVYADAHLIKPVKNNTMALWHFTEATYLAIAKEQHWLREKYNVEPGTLLVDGNGKQYKLRGVVDYPIGHNFWVEGLPGDYISFLLVFDPLPVGITDITYYEPEGEPFDAWGANWKGNVIPSLNVQTLRENQLLFDYHPREVVE
jgi:hypothetical protein